MIQHNESQIREFMEEIPKQLRHLDYDAIKIACNEYFKSLPFPIIDFTNEKFFFNQREYGGANVIYRAHRITNKKNSPHETLSEISFIPNDKLHKILKYGRLNKPHESMFYGALNIPTACTEAISKGNVFENTSSTILTVGVWKFETPLKLVLIPHSEKYFKKFYDAVNYKSETIQLEHIKEHNAKLRKDVGNEFDFEKLMFFADQSAKWDTTDDNDYEYKLSNYFADRVFNRIPEFPIDEDIDGIIYPSVSLSYQEKNIVLKPEVVMNKLKFIHAMEVWFVNFIKTGGGAKITPLRQRAIADKNGKLLWDNLR